MKKITVIGTIYVTFMKEIEIDETQDIAQEIRDNLYYVNDVDCCFGDKTITNITPDDSNETIYEECIGISA